LKYINILPLVDGGHRAIIFSRLGGVQKDIMTEGLHFRIPWFHYPIIYDIRSRPKKISSPTGSKDLQMVNISLRVLSRPDASTLPSMYRQLGLDYDEKVNFNIYIYINYLYFVSIYVTVM
jgi:prohibitin 2